MAYPVIDLFAGPGGLGEGFAAVSGEHGEARFESVAAIERDESSYQTLLLRHFVRQFPRGEFPESYYQYLKGDIEKAELYALHPHQISEARGSALKISLGPENHSAVKKIIEEKISNSPRWALVGGPPCQAYSLVGRSRMMGSPQFERDERHTLYLEYLKIIIDHRPPVFVMENVKGLLSATIEGKSAIDQIVRDLTNPSAAVKLGGEGLGYKLYSLSEAERPEGEIDPRLFVVRAEDYGVPQARHRMFIVGVRNDIDVRPAQLRPHKPPTVRQTIDGLPAIRSSLSKAKDTTQSWKAEILRLASIDIHRGSSGIPGAGEVLRGLSLDSLQNLDVPESTSSQKYTRFSAGKHAALKSLSDPRLKVLTSHEARGHMASDLRRYVYAAVFAEVTGKSPKLSDFPAALLPDHQNVELGRTGKMFSDRFRVQLPDQVSTTITSHISKDGHYFIHYDPAQCRSLTVREAARLQTFPDNYKFEGPRTQQYHQVGNAVPPYLAMQIAEIIAEVLDSVKVTR